MRKEKHISLEVELGVMAGCLLDAPITPPPGVTAIILSREVHSERNFAGLKAPNQLALRKGILGVAVRGGDLPNHMNDVKADCCHAGKRMKSQGHVQRNWMQEDPVTRREVEGTGS